MRRHAEQIWQVGITYVTHRWVTVFTLFTLGGILLVIVPNLIGAMYGKTVADRAPSMIMLLGFPALFGTMFLVMQAKAQFAHARARLIPGFSVPHQFVVGGLVLGLVVFYPLGVGWCVGVDPLGIVALSLAIAAPYAWSAHANRLSWMLLPMAVFFSLMTAWGVRWWILDAPSHWLVSSVIILCGVALLATWLRRLGQLREEAEDYRTPLQWQVGQKSGKETPEQRRLAAEQLRRNSTMARIVDAWHARLAGYHGHHRLRLVRLLRHGISVVPGELSAAVAAIVFAAIALFFVRSNIVGQKADIGPVWFPLQMALILPGIAAAQTLAGRRSRVAAELMRPLSRAELVDGLIAAVAWDALLLWLALNAAGLLVVRMVMVDQFTPAAFGSFLLLTSGLALAAFGLLLRTSTWNSLALRMTVIVPVSMATVIPPALWWTLRDEYGDLPFVAVALVLAAVGAWLILATRRAWLRLELG